MSKVLCGTRRNNHNAKVSEVVQCNVKNQPNIKTYNRINNNLSMWLKPNMCTLIFTLMNAE